MIKTGCKVELNRPLKVVEVTNGMDLRTVTVEIKFTNLFGGASLTQEVELPRKWLKEFDPKRKSPQIRIQLSKKKMWDAVFSSPEYGGNFKETLQCLANNAQALYDWIEEHDDAIPDFNTSAPFDLYQLGDMINMVNYLAENIQEGK